MRFVLVLIKIVRELLKFDLFLITCIVQLLSIYHSCKIYLLPRLTQSYLNGSECKKLFLKTVGKTLFDRAVKRVDFVVIVFAD